MDPSALHGRWRAVAPLPAGIEDHAIEFTPAGEAVYSVFEHEGIARMLLTWRLEGDVLVTDQPSEPREERTRFAIDAAGELRLGDPPGHYRREGADRPSDPDARLYALVLFGLRHGVASASGEEPFIPFLVGEDARGLRQLRRIVAEDPAAAEQQARLLASSSSDFLRCVWTIDGRVTIEGRKLDAAIATGSERGRARALLLAQPYEPMAAGAQRIGSSIAAGEPPSWL